jgi:hypothetical protein
MENRKLVIPTDVYNKDGELTRTDFHEKDGTFAFEAVWDERDEQTSKNREEFRKWSYLMAKRLGFEVLK